MKYVNHAVIRTRHSTRAYKLQQPSSMQPAHGEVHNPLTVFGYVVYAKKD